jgi:hypothetical protein
METNLSKWHQVEGSSQSQQMQRVVFRTTLSRLPLMRTCSPDLCPTGQSATLFQIPSAEIKWKRNELVFYSLVVFDIHMRDPFHLFLAPVFHGSASAIAHVATWMASITRDPFCLLPPARAPGELNWKTESINFVRCAHSVESRNAACCLGWEATKRK